MSMKVQQPGISNVTSNWTKSVQDAAKNYDLAVAALSAARAGGAAGQVNGLASTAAKNVEVTRMALDQVLDQRFDAVLTQEQVKDLKVASKTVEQASVKAEAFAFAPGVVVEKDNYAPPLGQAKEMLEAANKDGKTRGRLLDGRPLVVAPGADFNAALKAWQDAAPTGKEDVNIKYAMGGRVSSEQTRMLTAAVPNELSGPDRALWAQMTARFPNMTMNQRDNGTYYVGGMPEKKEGSMLRSMSGEGSDMERAAQNALAAFQEPKARIVVNARGDRQELTWDPSRKDLVPYMPYMTGLVGKALLSDNPEKGVRDALNGVKFPDVRLEMLTSKLTAAEGAPWFKNILAQEAARGFSELASPSNSSVDGYLKLLDGAGVPKDVQAAALKAALAQMEEKSQPVRWPSALTKFALAALESKLEGKA